MTAILRLKMQIEIKKRTFIEDSSKVKLTAKLITDSFDVLEECDNTFHIFLPDPSGKGNKDRETREGHIEVRGWQDEEYTQKRFPVKFSKSTYLNLRGAGPNICENIGLSYKIRDCE